MFGSGGWSQLEARYRVSSTALPLVPVKIAVVGGLFGRLRNMLHLGHDAQGLVLQKGGLLSSSTVYIPWAHIHRTSNPPLPIFTTPVESFLIGPEATLLTIPAGLVPRGG